MRYCAVYEICSDKRNGTIDIVTRYALMWMRMD
jgi:hypothetical protein